MASKYQKLLNKHVLVIGGTSGIGFCVAEASLASGAQVTVSSSNQSRVDATVEKLKAEFPDQKVAGYACDLSKPTVEQDLEALFSKVGKVDHLVFSAGDKLAAAPIQEITYDKIIAAGQVRFIAAFLAAKVGSKYLNPGPYSSITLTTGSVSQKPRPNVCITTALPVVKVSSDINPSLKWSMVAGFATGLHGLTRNLALDLKPIRVNLVSPGVVETELWDSSFDQEAKKKHLEGIAESLPTGRVAQPADVAESYLFLMKDPSVTGTVVDSNSGALLI